MPKVGVGRVGYSTLMVNVFFEITHPFLTTILDVDDKAWEEVLCGTYDSSNDTMTLYDGSTEVGKAVIEKLLFALDRTKSYPKLSKWQIVPMDELEDTRKMYAEQILKRAKEKLENVNCE